MRYGDLGFILTELNVHRILLAATVVATKYQDDDVYSNKYYARVGGVTSKAGCSIFLVSASLKRQCH